MRICFCYGPIAFGPHRPPINLGRLDDRPLTGTDLVSTCLPLAMAARGHDVSLYMDRAEAAHVAGVEVYPFTDWVSHDDDFDAVIATSNPNALADAPPSALRIVNRQVATFGCDAAPNWQSFTDLVVCPSRWARDLVRAPLTGKVPAFDVLPNGCDAPAAVAPKIPGRCLYISSPDRGLHWLLSAWPRIRARVPHATLRIAYESIGQWLAYSTSGRKPCNVVEEEQFRRAHYVAHALERLKPHGVECVPGGVTHGALQNMLAEAEALLYPLDPLAPTETFGVAVLEAQMHGCVPVVSTADAFGELWAGASAAVDAPVGKHLDAWIDAAVRVLSDADYRAERSAACRANAERHAWPKVAERLERIIDEHTAHKRAATDRAVVSLVRPEPLTLHAVLTEYASGNVAMDPGNPYEAKTGGGCRVGFNQLVRALPALGYSVRAFSTWAHTGEVEGVDHRQLSDLPSYVASRPDVVLAYYDTRPVGLPARITVASHHTYAVPHPHTILTADVNAAPSEHAVRQLRGCFGGDAWTVLPNIVPPDLPAHRPVLGRVLYHTSPDRGLHLLVGIWPEVRRRVPGATLHVVGDVDGWTELLRGRRGGQGDRCRAMLAALPAALDAGGVEMLGKVTRSEINRELSEAAAFAFPADPVAPCEVWSTSIVECMAVGVPVVLAPCDSLGELWGEATASILGPARDCMGAFTDVLCDVLTSERRAEHVRRRQRERVAPYTAEHAAGILDGAIRAALGEGKRVAA